MIERNGTVEIPQLLINRADKANSLTIPLLDELAEVFSEVIDIGARSVILSGANGRFSAGADLDELTGTGADADFDAALGRVTEMIVSAPVLVIAAVERYAYGAAVDLAWSCDVVVVGAGVRVAVPATSLGILYNPEALRRLHARVGSRALRQLLIANREVAADDIADVVVAAGHALHTAADIASAAATNVVKAVAATKRVLDDLDHGRANSAEWEALQRELLSAPERIAALRRRGAIAEE